MWPTNQEFRTKSAEARFERLRKLVDSMDTLPTTARVPMRILELHRSRSSTLQQYGEALMADAALSFDEVRALRFAESAPSTNEFPEPRDQALIAWVDAVAGGRGALPDAVNVGVKQHFADHEIVEITVLAGATMLLNRYATALQLPVAADTLSRLVEEGFVGEAVAV